MKTFGELPREEQMELFEAWLDGKEIETYAKWYSKSVYRVKPPKKIKWYEIEYGEFSFFRSAKVYPIVYCGKRTGRAAAIYEDGKAVLTKWNPESSLVTHIEYE